MKFTCNSLPTVTENLTKELIKLNCLLAHLTRSHRYGDALQLFHQIHSSHHLRPDHYTLCTAITACANLRDSATGNQLHACATRSGLVAYPHVANTLLSLYAKSGDLVSVKRAFGEIRNPDVYSWTTLLSACTKLGEVDYACKLFDQMPQENVAVWNAIITGCAENGNVNLALCLFNRMNVIGVRHDNYSFASVLCMCSSELLDFGRQVHSLVVKAGFLVRTSVINALLTMYFKCEGVTEACEVFEEAEGEVHDQITYNAMIAGLVSVGREEEALVIFKDMQNVGLRATELTFVSVLSSCSGARLGYQVHAQAVKMGFEAYTSVSNVAIMMYSTCQDFHAAHVIFERLDEKDTVSWNTMITSYAQGNMGRAAILAYLQMQRTGFEADEFTIGSLLASSDLLVNVEMIQALVLKNALISKVEVSNALLSALSRHSEIQRAHQDNGKRLLM